MPDTPRIQIAVGLLERLFSDGSGSDTRQAGDEVVRLARSVEGWEVATRATDTLVEIRFTPANELESAVEFSVTVTASVGRLKDGETRPPARITTSAEAVDADTCEILVRVLTRATEVAIYFDSAFIGMP